MVSEKRLEADYALILAAAAPCPTPEAQPYLINGKRTMA